MSSSVSNSIPFAFSKTFLKALIILIVCFFNFLYMCLFLKASKQGQEKVTEQGRAILAAYHQQKNKRLKNLNDSLSPNVSPKSVAPKKTAATAPVDPTTTSHPSR